MSIKINLPKDKLAELLKDNDDKVHRLNADRYISHAELAGLLSARPELIQIVGARWCNNPQEPSLVYDVVEVRRLLKKKPILLYSNQVREFSASGNDEQTVIEIPSGKKYVLLTQCIDSIMMPNEQSM